MPTYADMVDPLKGGKDRVAQVTPPAPMEQPAISMPMEPEAPVEESPIDKLSVLPIQSIIDFLKAKAILPEDFTPPTPETTTELEPSFDDMSVTPPVSVAGSTL
jgi:hypothetical protein